MLECLLAVVTLAEVESKFVLCRADLAEDVIVGFPLQECIADAWMAIVCRIVQRSPLAMILSIDVGSVLKKHHAGV